MQAYHGHYQALQVLLESFLDIDIKDHNGRVFLECTCPTCAFFFCNAVVLSIFCVLDF